MTARRVALGLLLALCAQRAVYHAGYLLLDPFARATFSDGQLYEDAARDLLAHPPWGTQPLYLQGLYAYVLALGIGFSGSVFGALALQLALCALALWAFACAARAALGERAGAVSTLVLLAYPSVAFYENKHLSVGLGDACNMLALAAFVYASRAPSFARVLGAGAASGLAVLGRANLVLALPFTLLALLRRRPQGPRPARVVLPFALGALLALAPLSVRNLVVIGRADVLPSHGGGIPFYIGNNPSANGRWNTAGGLLSGQVARERQELAAKLALRVPAAELDQAIGAELYRRAFAFIRDQPLSWLALLWQKLWCALGNHAFVRDYDLLGERELLGALHPIGLPFGVLLGLGLLGAVALLRGRSHGPLLLVVLGQLVAVLAANLAWFTSAQNRVPLAIPLALLSGPGLLWLWESRDALRARARSAVWPVALAALVTAQAFVPRLPTYRPSSAHYFNLAQAQETLGRRAAALRHYAVAAERSPKQPMFLLRHARLARQLGDEDGARASLAKLRALPEVPADIQRAAERLASARRR